MCRLSLQLLVRDEVWRADRVRRKSLLFHEGRHPAAVRGRGLTSAQIFKVSNLMDELNNSSILLCLTVSLRLFFLKKAVILR